MDEDRKYLFKYFFLPLITLLSIYYGFAWAISSYLIHQPHPELGTLLKYCISWIADFAGLEFFTFSLPVEWKAWILANFPNFPQQYPVNGYHLLLDKLQRPILYKLFPFYFLGSTIVCLIYASKKLATVEKKPEPKKKDKYIRGVRRAGAAEFCQLIKKKISDPAAAVRVELPANKHDLLFFSGNRLREHMSIFGASGSGKSQFLLSFLFSFLRHKQPGTRCIIIDRKGEFWAHFGTKEDILFHPFDKRSVCWSIFNELDIPKNFTEEPADVRAIAKILFPATSSHKDPYWENAAADVFCSAVAVCIRDGKTTNKDLVNFCTDTAKNIIHAFKELPPGLAAGKVLGENPDSMTAGSILSTLKTGIRPLAVCEDGTFSVKNWIHNGRGSLFLSSAGKNDKVFIPVLSILFDMIGREIKELPDNGGGGVKYLFCIDELAAYRKLDTLHFLVAEARSKGVATIVATQTLQKLYQVYGEKDGRDIIGNTKTKIIFKAGEAQDAEYLSKTIGSGEIERSSRSENVNSIFSNNQPGATESKRITLESVFIGGELQTLDTGNAVILHPNAGEAVAKLKFSPFLRKKLNQEFVKVEEDSLPARAFAKIKQEETEEIYQQYMQQTKIDENAAETFIKQIEQEKKEHKKQLQQEQPVPKQEQPEKEEYLIL